MRTAILACLLGWVLMAVGCQQGEATERSRTPDSDVGQVADASTDSSPAPDAIDARDVPHQQDVPARGDGGPDTSAQDSDASDLGSGDSDMHDAGGVDADAANDPDAGPQGPFVVWMAPDGDDGRDGLSQSSAVHTLERVEQILAASQPTTDVEVRIEPGRYRGQSVEWNFSVPDHSVTFTRLSPNDDRPVFDGCVSTDQCPGGTLFRLRRSDGAETRIEFNYIRVENYQTAISLDGSRNDLATTNGSNRIYGCYFYRIGNVFNPSLSPSTAAVRLVNSDDNVIANNHFVDIINTTQENRLHAIYVAHMSSRNQILRNRFVNNSGDPVRVRDYSNDNSVNDNTFIQSGQYAGYTEWYCDHDARDDCTKVDPECPSWGNEFRRNTLDGNYQCDPLGTFEYFQGDSTTGCSPPSPSARRLRTSDNTRTNTPCQG